MIIPIAYGYSGNRMTQRGQQDLGWDGNGQLTSDEVRTIGWTWDGQLRSATNAGSGVVCRYDPDGNRIRREVQATGQPTQARKYIVDTEGDVPVVLLEIDPAVTDPNQAITKTFLYADTQLVAFHDGFYGDTLYFALSDQHGSVRQVVNDSGTVVNGYAYDPWGSPLTGPFFESTPEPIRYVYDDQGRLIETIDAQGHRIGLSHNTNGRTETVNDRSENETVYKYNSRGNVVEVIRFQGTAAEGVFQTHTLYEYPASGKNIDKPTKVSQLVDWTDDNPAQPVYAVTETTFGTAELVSPGGKALSVDTETVVDPVLNKTVNCTDANGRLIKSTQYKPIGDNLYIELASTWNTYSPTGLLLATETTTGSGTGLQRHSFTANLYDTRNRLLHTVQVDTKNVTNFSPYYSLGSNESNQVTGIPDSDRMYCIVTSYKYDKTESGSDDQPYAVTDPYCPWNNSTQIVPFSNPNVVKRYFHYDSEGRQDQSWYNWYSDSTHCQQVVSVTNYDKMGRVTSTERKIIPLVKTGETWVQNGTIQTVPLSTTEYNEIGKPKKTTDENQIVTKYWYDETGNLVETEVFAVYDEQTPANNVLLTTTRTLFDAEGRAIVTVGPYAATDTPVGTETVYDALGRVVETRRWANVTIEVSPFVVDSQGHFEAPTSGQKPIGKRVWESYVVRNAWDGNGTSPNNIAWRSDGQVPNVTNTTICLSRTHTDYDVAGRVYRSYAPTQSTTGKGVCTQEIHYDAAGRQVEVISLPEDAAKRAVTVTHYDGPRQDWTRDARNNVTSFEYDALGRMIRTIHPATAYKIDSGTTITPASGPVYSHVGYDGFGRKLYETPPVASAEYEHADRYKIFAYDPAGRLTMVMLPKVDDPQDSPDRGLVYPIYRYYYDSYGNQIGILDPLGRVTVMEYDEQNRLVKKYQPYPVAGLDDLSSVAVFPAWSTLVTNRPGNQPFEGTIYDPHGRVVERVDYEGHTTVYRYYVNDVSSNDHFMSGTPSTFLGIPGQLRVEESYNGVPGGTPDGTLAYTYDKLGRKKTETVTPGSNEVYKTWYDDEGRIEIYESPQGDLLYEYDSVTGLKTAMTSYPAAKTPEQIRDDAAATPPYAASTTRTVYTYDDLGRLFTVQVVRRNNADVNPPEETKYTYNDNGSRESVLLPNGVCTQYQYNSMNRLREVVNFQTQPTLADPNKPQLSRFLYRHYADGQRASAWERQKPVNNVEKLVLCRYDGLNRLSYESHYEVNSTGYGYRAKYAYDLAGNRTERQGDLDRFLRFRGVVGTMPL